MIEIDFKIDQQEIEDILKENLLEIPSAALDETCFIMPVRLKINGIDFLKVSKNSNGPWAPLPIMSIAKTFFDLIKGLNEKKQSVYYTPGFAEMKLSLLEDGKISLYWEQNHIEVLADNNELLNALKEFESKVKVLLNNEVPQLRAHPSHWANWLNS